MIADELAVSVVFLVLIGTGVGFILHLLTRNPRRDARLAKTEEALRQIGQEIEKHRGDGGLGDLIGSILDRIKI